MNNVCLIGRLKIDPEIKYNQVGLAILRFTLVVDRKLSKEKKKELQNNNQLTADFISCIAFGKTAEVIANYNKKGSQLGIEGKIQTGSYEKNGVRKYTTDVLVESITFCNKNTTNSNNSNNNSYEDEGLFPIDDGDIPF